MDSKELRNLMEAYVEVYAPQEVDEAVKGESSERRRDLAAERKAGHRPLPAKEGEKYASHKLAQMAYAKRKRMGEEVDIFDTVLEFLQAEGFAETLEEAEWMMANVIDEEAIEIILGEEQLDEISDRRVQGMLAKREKQDRDSGGISAGYMANRRAQQAAARRNVRTGSKVKVDPILSKEEYMDEAQHARENPEKYEREQSKKSAPVRGERTPMPPRGDKRREDFEKWYAKQMGR